MKCSKCGTINKESNVYCKNCGYDLTINSTSNTTDSSNNKEEDIENNDSSSFSTINYIKDIAFVIIWFGFCAIATFQLLTNNKLFALYMVPFWIVGSILLYSTINKKKF